MLNMYEYSGTLLLFFFLYKSIANIAEFSAF